MILGAKYLFIFRSPNRHLQIYGHISVLKKEAANPTNVDLGMIYEIRESAISYVYETYIFK